MTVIAEELSKDRGSKSGSRTGQGWCIPRTIDNFGGKLMSQQVWCWGRDVECEAGNLLMHFGFEQHRDTEDYERSTCYRLDQDDIHVCLWAWGMFFGSRDLGGLLLDRFDFCPTWAPIESLSLNLHWPDELPSFTRPKGKLQWLRARKLWKRALSWIADYEAWIDELVTPEYRQECVETWLRPHVKADEMVAAWRFLSRQLWADTRSVSKQLNQFKIRTTRPR